MKHLILAAATAALVGTMPGLQAANEIVINDEMSRRPAGSVSESGDTVEANCPTDPSGNNWQDATADLRIEQVGDSSVVQIKVKDALPNTHFTVWLRIKGGSGFNDAGSPWTGGGTTPLCSGTEFADLNAISPWNNPAGDTEPHCNSFYTTSKGGGQFKASINFPVVGGAYPFQQSGGDPAGTGGDTIPDVPTAIVDPRTGNGGPFLLRVVSHCTDQSTHGLSPAIREAWFQFP